MKQNRCFIKQSRASKDTRTGILIMRGLGILFALLLVHSVAEAGCPLIGPTLPAWMSRTTTYTLSTGCTVDVGICYRCTSTGQMQIAIEWLIPNPNNGTNCNGTDPTVMIAEALDVALADASNYSGICSPDPCPSTHWSVIGIRATCWKLSSTTNRFEACEADSAWCTKQCTVCISGGNVSLSNCTYSHQGYSSPSCTTLPAMGTAWTRDVCYLLNCGT